MTKRITTKQLQEQLDRKDDQIRMLLHRIETIEARLDKASDWAKQHVQRTHHLEEVTHELMPRGSLDKNWVYDGKGFIPR